jgi:hypothetical protein
MHRPLKTSFRIKKKREIDARSPLIIAWGSSPWVKNERVATIKAKVKMRHMMDP